MRFNSSLLLALSYAVLVSSRDCKSIKDNKMVKNCSTDKAIFKIASLKISPTKPKKGENITITAVGKLSKPIEKGAKFHYDIKMNGNKILSKDEDLCEYAEKEKTGYKCPVKAGDLTIKHSFDIPKFAPSGNYTIDGYGLTKAKEQIFDAQIITQL